MRIMKDSGIAWIGEIPIDWNKNKVFRIFDIIGSGTTPKSNNEQNFIGTIKWIQSGDINGAELFDCKTSISENAFNSSSALKIYRAPYIIIAMYGASVGNISISNIDACVNQACCVLGGRVYNLKYAYYALKTAKDYLVWKAVGGGQPNISQDTIKQLWLPDPSQKAKERIARFLDVKCSHIDSVIEKTRAVIEEYKRLKQSIITQAVTKGIRPNRKMKYSGIKWIREIPIDWKAILITRILDYSHPYPLGDGDHGLIKTESYQQTGVPYIRVQNLSWGTDLILNNLVYISEEDNNRIINSTLKPNDILFAKTGATIGKTGIVPDSIPIANTTSHIGKLTVSDTVNSKYVFYCLSSHVGYRQFWERACLKATRPELTIDEIRSIKVILPDSFSEQSEIVAYLDEKTAAIDSLIQKKEQLITELEAYKKSLIYEYVTGKKEFE